MTIYVGTYITDAQETVYTYKVDEAGNSIAKPAIHAGPNPSFLCFNADRTCLYAVNELEKDTHGSVGAVQCLKQTPENTYIPHSKWSSNGDAPCHVTLNKDETLLFVTNYGAATLCVYSLAADGGIAALVQTCAFSGNSVHHERQARSHPHQSRVSPCGKYLFVTDLGCDCIYVFAIHAYAPLERVDTVPMPKGSGPRHMVFSDCSRYLYIVGELSSSVMVCSYKDGTLNLIQNAPAFLYEPTPYPRSAASEIVYYKHRVYMSNRGDDSITLFQTHDDGTLQHIKNILCGGKNPRHFKIFYDAPWGGQGTVVVANQGSHSITFFSVHEGTITQIQVYVSVPSPSVIL